MHKDFADWYRMASIDPRDVPLKQRWEAIETIGQVYTKSDLFGVLELAFNWQSRAKEFEDSFRVFFKNTDDAFAMRKNDIELQVLAMAACAHLIESGSEDIKNALSLGVVCIDLKGLGKKALLGELLQFAQKHLSEQSAQSHAALLPIRIERISEAIFNVDVAEAEADEKETDASVADLRAVFDTFANIPDQIIENTEKAIELLLANQRQQQEENNILWWLFSEYSSELKKSVLLLDLNSASIIFGVEMAAFIQTLPGPIGAEAFMDKMLSKVETQKKVRQVVLTQAIESGGLDDWKIQFAKKHNFEKFQFLCPISSGLYLASTASSKKTWPSAFTKICGVKSTEKILATNLSLQVYQEFLLVKAFS